MKINHITQLTELLTETIDGLKNGSTTLEEGSVTANVAGKIIKSVQVQIDYARARKEIPDVAFMTKKTR
jgi:hypothetical protein